MAEFEGEDAMGMERGATDNKDTSSLESSEHHIELCLPSKAMVGDHNHSFCNLAN